MEIDLSPIIQPLLALVATLLSGLIVVGIRYVAKRVGLDSIAADQALQGRIDGILDRGTDLAIRRLRDKGWTRVKTQSDVVNTALSYAVDAAPQLLKKAGLDPTNVESRAKLHRMIEARLLPKRDAIVVDVDGDGIPDHLDDHIGPPVR